MTQVELRDATLQFPTATVEASFVVPSGRRLALLGASGCGKTTTLRIIAGLAQPDHGDVLFDNVSVLDRPPEQRGAVMVFQDHALFPFRTVADNVGYGLKLRRVARAERATRVNQALSLVHLDGFGDRWPDDLSGGQRQRVALARAIIVEPRLLLLDEPLSSLDRELRAELRDTICSLQRATGITTVLVTHDQDEAHEMADLVAVMIDGRVRQVGPPDEVFESPADDAVARFLGTPASDLAGRR